MLRTKDSEAQIDDSDLPWRSHADDLTDSRGKGWPSPDNVFELGCLWAALAERDHMEREEKLKLPSDLAGITTITYR